MVPPRDPVGELRHACSADARAAPVAPPGTSRDMDRKISAAGSPSPPAAAARSARSYQLGSALTAVVPALGTAARAAANTSTARDDKPPRSHADISDTYAAVGRSVLTPLARVVSAAVLASRVADASAASAAAAASDAAVLPERIAAAVSTGGGATLARATSASAVAAAALAASSASLSFRAWVGEHGSAPTTSSMDLNDPDASHAAMHAAATPAPGVCSGSLSRISRQIVAASTAAPLLEPLGPFDPSTCPIVEPALAAAHACMAAVYMPMSGSTAFVPARYRRIASSTLPPAAHAPITAAYECLSGLIPSSRIDSNTARASSHRPALSHAASTELHVMTLASTPARRICLYTSSASSHRRPFSHAEMTAPYVMASGSTPAAWHSRKISSALSSCRPLAHADMSAE